MTGKNTKAKRMIQKLGLLYGVNYDHKTFRNITKILECYREYVFGQDIFDFSMMGKRSMSELLPCLYRQFISKEEISDQIVNTMVIQIINDEFTKGILEKTIEDIKKFSDIGEEYFYILNNLFFTKDNISNTDIYLDLDYSPAQYSYRKEEAIMVFGIYFWQECLKYWTNRVEEMDKIKIEMDRCDLMPVPSYAS